MQVKANSLEISPNILAQFQRFVVKSFSNYYLYVNKERTDKILRYKNNSRCSKS